MVFPSLFRKHMVLFILLILLLLIKFINSGTSSSQQPEDILFRKAKFFYSDPIPDTLPHNVYINREGSLKMKFYAENRAYDNGFTLLNLGAFSKKTDRSEQFFFSLHNYEFRDHGSAYFRKDGKKYFIYDKNGSMEIESTSLYLSVNGSDEKLSLFLPISHTSYQVISASIYLAAFIFIVYFLYLFVFLPLGILFKISKGDPFHPENLSGLFKIGKLMIIIGTIAFMVKLISHAMVGKMLPSLISFSYFEAFIESWDFFTIGIIVLIIASAFQTGAQLKDEQDLTV